MALYIVVTPYKKDEYKLYPLKAEGTPLFTGVLTLQKTSKGMRPLKVRIVKNKEDEYLPIPTFVELIKASDEILTSGLSASQEDDLNDMLKAYQLTSRSIGVCRFCLMEDRITFRKSDMIRFKNEMICVPCAKRELRKEVSFAGRMSSSGIDRLESLLMKTRDLNRVMALFNPSNLPPELTMYDIIPAADNKIKAVKVKDLKIDERLKGLFLPKMQELLPVQSKSVNLGLTDGRNQLVVSATATGKTLIGEIAGINNCLNKKGKMLFLVPLVALANQKYEQFKKRYSPLGLKTSIRIGTSRIALNSVKLNTSLDADIIVGTYEGLDYVLRMGQVKNLKKIGTVVIDEVHMLEDEDRGHRLDGLIARLRSHAPDAQFIYLSATIGNPGEVSKNLSTTLVEYEHRPVPLERHLIFARSHEKNRLIEEYAGKEYSKTSSKGFKGQSIVFTNSRKKCHSISQSLRIQSAPYHAGLTYPQRKKVEEMFAKGELKVVVTTAALAAGVDFPASQVIFESLAMGNNWLTVGEFQQMQGRAGRPDYHDKGQIVVLSDPEMYMAGGESEEEVAFRLLGGSVEHINVEYDDPVQMEECIANTCISHSETELEKINDTMFGITVPTRSLINKSIDKGLLTRENGHINATPLGRAIVTHFLAVEDAFMIRERLGKKVPPIDITVELEVFDAAYFRGIDRLSKVIGVNVPSRVFSPASLDIVFSGESISKMDHSMRSQFTDFSVDFLDCVCEDAPFCGCPERKFSKKIIEYRLQGKSPAEITRAVAGDYNLSVFDGDILGYLDRFIRNLDAVYEIAKILGKQEAAKEARVLKDKVENAED
ncbi:ATP-dependent DNA helicase [Methanocella sp. CWC-04]|uniref:ATP-dependent DNA helicase n=1 Tax=Methanooceanicella nereidis TaxID=2052831 RepID=A0AAP2RBW6_9EURY|nr:DEAD/DEAH box helicase [Methanocella sp. CWC-04]MCD1294721.1 ATP-dependent DNA helicase [Methanocella sp. CWC-04]